MCALRCRCPGTCNRAVCNCSVNTHGGGEGLTPGPRAPPDVRGAAVTLRAFCGYVRSGQRLARPSVRTPAPRASALPRTPEAPHAPPTLSALPPAQVSASARRPQDRSPFWPPARPAALPRRRAPVRAPAQGGPCALHSPFPGRQRQRTTTGGFGRQSPRSEHPCPHQVPGSPGASCPSSPAACRAEHGLQHRPHRGGAYRASGSQGLRAFCYLLGSGPRR